MSGILGSVRVEPKMFGQLEIPFVEQLFNSAELCLSEAVWTDRVDRLHDHAQDDSWT